MKRVIFGMVIVVFVLLVTNPLFGIPAKSEKIISINVLLNEGITDATLSNLSKYGNILDVFYEINAVTMQVPTTEFKVIQSLPYVKTANTDAIREGAPIDTVEANDFSNGNSTWNLDAIDITDFGSNNRQVTYDGTGVYVAVLDIGLLDSWRKYFPQERISIEYAKSFGGGGNEVGGVSEQPNKWEHDQNSHGTHVTSTIIGYNMNGKPINGVAPKATIIPVKVLNQNGNGWSSVVARGIVYVADLKDGPLADKPVVISMSLGGPTLDALEKAAIDYAINKGVIVVASAGNEGEKGMGYPGAYEPVISVAASGWIGEWQPNRNWWYNNDVPDPTDPKDFYITDFSSRELPGQDLDVAAPGSWVVGPYQLQSGKTSYYFLGGTSMAAPHVSGIVALMAQKDSTLTASKAENILETSSIDLAPGCRDVATPYGNTEYCWGENATGHGLTNAVFALDAIP